MGASVLAEDWLSGWAARLQAAVEEAVNNGMAGLPFEADEQQVGPPASDAELADLQQRVPWTPDDLVALHRHVGAVSLPDIGNGYFIHTVDDLIAALDRQDGADQVGEPFTEPMDVVVFGSDGGGALYAVAVADGRVFRLQDAAYVDGVYDATELGLTLVGADVRAFCERLLNAVTAFATSGDITDL